MMREDFDLVAALGTTASSFGSAHRLDVRFERVGRARALAPEAQLALFRVLQECLSNAAKHAARAPWSTSR